MSNVKLIHGDSLVELKYLADNSVDSVVTDPPYGLSFVGIEREQQYLEIAGKRINGADNNAENEG